MKSFFTGSQQRALAKLRQAFELRGATRRVCGVGQKNIRLIIGPSGVGKTAIVSRLVDEGEGKVSMSVISASTWNVIGSIQRPSTMEVIRTFLTSDEKEKILFIDEVDKATGGDSRHTTWGRSQFVELLALLDRSQSLTSMGFTTDELERLQAAFVVAAGAWQAVATAQRGPSSRIGFGGGAERDDRSYDELVASDFGIEPELFFRFHPRLITIDYPTAEDYRLGIRAIREDLRLPVLTADDEEMLIADAIDSHIGFRWFEALVADLAAENPENFRRTVRRVQVGSDGEFPDFDQMISTAIKLKREQWQQEWNIATEVMRNLPFQLATLERILAGSWGTIQALKDEAYYLILGGLAGRDESESEEDVGLISGLEELSSSIHHWIYAWRKDARRVHDGLSVKWARYVFKRIHRLTHRHATLLGSLDAMTPSLYVEAELSKFLGLVERLNNVEVID